VALVMPNMHKKHHLNEHIAAFHNGKKLKFDFCEHKFSQKGNLKAHIASVHEGKKTIQL
jgi:hypothetical protein